MNKLVKTMGTAYFKVRGFYPASIRGKQFKCDPCNISFWRTAEQGKWENETYDVLDKYVKPGMTCMDIGAWIGPTVTYSARIAAKVICFEPDVVAYRHLLWNIDLNRLRNVIPYNAALSNQSGVMKMSSFGEHLGDSMTSLLNPDAGGDSIDVPVLGWNDLCAMTDLEDVGFIKMDIEGGEFSLLPVMKEYLQRVRPVFYLSLHGKYLPPDDREEAMAGVISAVSHYGRCLDECMNEIVVEDLAAPAVLDEARTFLFLSE